jgi:PAS domain S-box-containing protein
MHTASIARQMEQHGAEQEGCGMQHVNLSLRQTLDGRLLVTSQVVGIASPAEDGFSATAYPDENLFLERLIAAGLTPSQTNCLVAAVLLVMQGSSPEPWIRIDLNAMQLRTLGLDIHPGTPETPRSLQLPPELFAMIGDRGLNEVLIRSTTPFAVAVGEDYHIAFMNDPYAHILGKEHAQTLIGKPLLTVLPELRGSTCIQSLEKVYRTGEPENGIEVKKKVRLAGAAQLQEAHFELSYNPIKNDSGDVLGVMVLATDITEKVLDRQVSASREELLYRQWAELETIYRVAPLAMCYFDAREYRIIRANRLQAQTMGAPEEELIGKSVLQIFPHMTGLRELFERVAHGETINNLEFTTDFPSAPGIYRSWLLNYSPIFDAFGNVEMITSIAMEVTGYDANSIAYLTNVAQMS